MVLNVNFLSYVDICPFHLMKVSEQQTDLYSEFVIQFTLHATFSLFHSLAELKD